jgi:hypothetical protein
LRTYSALMFLENQYGVSMMRQELERSQRLALSLETTEPLTLGYEMESPEAVYALNYHKGAAILHMLREVMGLDGFAQLCRALHEHGTDLTTASFTSQAEAIYGDDLSWFFASWLESSAVPQFLVRYGYQRLEGSTSLYELNGVIEQEGAEIRHPVLLRVSLEAAPPLEQTVWVGPESTEFSITLPSPPRGLEFDPYGDLLHRGARIETVGSASPSREEEAVQTPTEGPDRSG